MGDHAEVTRALLYAAPKTKYANGVTDQLKLFRDAADNVASSHLNDLERLYEEVEGEPEKTRMREEIYKEATDEAIKAINGQSIVILKRVKGQEEHQRIVEPYTSDADATGLIIPSDALSSRTKYVEVTSADVLRELFKFGTEESVAMLMRRRLVEHSSLMVRPHATRHGSQKRSASALDPFDPTGGASKSWELDVSDRPPAAHGTACRAVVLAAAAGLCPRVESPGELRVYDENGVTRCYNPTFGATWTDVPQKTAIAKQFDGSFLVTIDGVRYLPAITSGHDALDDMPFGTLTQYVSDAQKAVYMCRPFPSTLWYWRPGGLGAVAGLDDPGGAHYFTLQPQDETHTGAVYIDGAERHLTINFPPLESISAPLTDMVVTLVSGGISQPVSPSALFVGDSASSEVVSKCSDPDDREARKQLLSAHPFQERGCHDIELRQNVLDAFGACFPRRPYGSSAADFIKHDCYTLVQSAELDGAVDSHVIEMSNFYDRWCVYQGVSDADTAVGATVVAVTRMAEQSEGAEDV